MVSSHGGSDQPPAATREDPAFSSRQTEVTASPSGPQTVVLRHGEARRVLAGHPWIYESAIDGEQNTLKDGEVVHVTDHRRRFLGTGIWNSRSKIRVRLISRNAVGLDRQYFLRGIQSAMAARHRWLPAATSYRIVNAESDGMSGLIIDRYQDVVVLQTTARGMDDRRHIIVESITELLQPKAIFERNDIPSRRFEGLPQRTGWLLGSQPQGEVQLNGLKFQVSFESGHKTGLYLDQQINYERVARRAAGARVLDCFCFAGGFSLHAARAGALEVLGLEQSETAVQQSRDNAALNALDCRFETVNVFDWLRTETRKQNCDRTEPRFDLIILDPPSFTRNRQAVPDALRGYKEIHLRALKLLRPGGFLATFCCSHHIHATMFREVIQEAAFDAHKVLRQVTTYSQSPDHPILPAVPETEYLKGFGLEIAF